MRIIKTKTRYHEYAFESDYDEKVVGYCKFLKDTFGWREFQWDDKDKMWRFKDPSIIIMFKNKYPEIITDYIIEQDIFDYNQNIEKESKKKENADRIRNAEVSNLEIKGIKGKLYEYQKLGVEFFLNSGGRALLADSPGVGKTAQTLAYITHSGFKRNLIVCPASVKFSWEIEIDKWTKMKSFIVNSKTNLADIPFEIECVIINFDILKKFHNEFKKYKWDCLVVDECHLIKTPTAIRSKVVKSIAIDIKNVIMLTGTPILSRPIEMFNMLSIIDPKVWNNYYSYAVKYCGGKQGRWGFEDKGATNLEELNSKISKYFLRRTKDQVLKELPPKRWTNIPIDLPSEVRKNYNLVEKNLIEYLKNKKDKTDKEAKKSMQAEKLVKLNLLREINTIGKIPTAKEIIDSILESGEKVLVFSSFRAPLKELEESYEENSVMITGETPVEERGEIVKKFQEDPNIQIFFGGTKSAGTGITLTAASNIIFLDFPWNPADIIQSENRAHRPGAEYQSLNIYTIISRNSIDGFMQSLLKKKQEISDQIIDGKEIKNINKKLTDEYIEELKLKHK